MERKTTAASDWARLDPQTTVFASDERAFIGRGPASQLPSRARPRTLTVATTRRLLDGAVAAGFRFAEPTVVPPLTATRWAYRLAGLYHLTHSTPTLLRAAGLRFAEQGRTALASWAEARAREETHHDRLALRDLAALGLDGTTAVERLRPATAMTLLDVFTRSALADDPIGCVGYAYALERLAMTVGQADIDAVEAVLPPGVRATRCLRVHSATGSDTDHVAETLEVVATLSPDEREAIAATAYATSRSCFAPGIQAPPSDADIEAMLAA